MSVILTTHETTTERAGARTNARTLQGQFPMTNSATKSAIITGASGGIGGSIAKRLAKDGFSVVVHYVGKPAPAQAVVADLKAAGGQGIAVQAEVARAEDVERLFKESMDAFGRPDVVVKAKGVREHGNFKSKRRTEWET